MSKGTKVTSKSGLSSSVSSLKNKASDLELDVSSLKRVLSSVSDTEGFSLSSGADKLSSNIDNKFEDIETIIINMSNYSKGLIAIDSDDFGEESTAETKKVSINDDEFYQTDGSREGNARVIWNFLKAKGLSDAAAAGVLGNIQAESGFDPAIVEIATGVGYGLIQWSFGRRTSLEQTAAARGEDSSSLKFQLQYLWEESLDPNTSYGKQLAAAGFYDTDSASDAAYYFHKYVEISNDSYDAIRANRCNTAEAWYQQLKGTSAGEFYESTGSIISASAESFFNKPNSLKVVSNTGGYTSSSGYVSSVANKINNKPDKVKLNLTKVIEDSGNPNIDIGKYHNNLSGGFEVTVGNETYELTDEEIELLCAIVAAESDKSYDDALAVITTILNRCEDERWIASYGISPLAQATAPNQFVVYQEGTYEQYMDGNLPTEVTEAVEDALAGVRNHKYLGFRSNKTTSYSSNMISATGNRYK